MMYLENNRQVKEVVMADQVAMKKRLGDWKLGFRCLLGIIWARRVMFTTMQRT